MCIGSCTASARNRRGWGGIRLVLPTVSSFPEPQDTWQASGGHRNQRDVDVGMWSRLLIGNDKRMLPGGAAPGRLSPPRVDARVRVGTAGG